MVVPELPPRSEDIVQALQASRPHRQVQFAAETELAALMYEVRDDQAAQSPEQLAARQREIDGLETQVAQERKAALGAIEELKARFPGAKISFAERAFGDDLD